MEYQVFDFVISFRHKHFLSCVLQSDTEFFLSVLVLLYISEQAGWKSEVAVYRDATF